MGNCVGVSKTGLKQIGAYKYQSVVHEKEYYLLRLIYADLGSRIAENQVNLQNFLLFFEKNGYWGNRLFKQFDVGQSNLITQEQFIKGIVKIFKTTEDQKIELLYKFFSGNMCRTQGVGFSQFLTMLYNYPKQDFKKILNDEEFFNKELKKKLIANNSRFKGRRLDSICMSQNSYKNVTDTTFQMDQNQNQNVTDGLESKMASEILNQIYKKNKSKCTTTFKIKIGQTNLQVATINIHHMVKKFAISIFKGYNINIKTGKLQFEQFKDWMLKHKQLYDDYYKGFHSQIWEIDRSTMKPQFVSKQMQLQSLAYIYLSSKPKKVIISLLRSTLLVRELHDLNTPVSIVCLDGLSAKKVFDDQRGWGIQITHRDQIYSNKRFYLKDEIQADKWMQSLKFYQGCSITMLYQMGQKIGIGKFSIVYKCIEKQTNQKYAIKVIQSSKLQQQARKLIAHESSIMSILSHPIIVTYKESIQTKTNIYIVTELVEGKDMLEYVKDSKSLNQSDAAFIIKQIIVGVRYLHSLGIVHRDLKPQNIMIQCNETNKNIRKIRIIDFGFSNYLQSLKNLPQQETIAGTPNYIAPQSLRLQPNINQKIDNFAIGSILYFALSGNLAFGNCKTKQIFQNTLNGTYQINDKKWKTISKQAKDLVNKLLENNPEDRISLDQALTHAWFSKFSIHQQSEGKTHSHQNIPDQRRSA